MNYNYFFQRVLWSDLNLHSHSKITFSNDYYLSLLPLGSTGLYNPLPNYFPQCILKPLIPRWKKGIPFSENAQLDQVSLLQILDIYHVNTCWIHKSSMQPIFDYRTLLFSPPQQARIAQNTLCKHFTKASLNSISRSSVSLSHCKKAVFFKPLEQKQMERMMKGRQRAKTYSIHTEQDLLATHLQNRV